MKTLIYGVLFLIFAAMIVVLGDHYYDVYHSPASTDSTDEKKHSTKTETNTADNKQSNNSETQNQNVLASSIKTPPHFMAGFDWSLPTNTQISNYSGLIAEEGENPTVVI